MTDVPRRLAVACGVRMSSGAGLAPLATTDTVPDSSRTLERPASAASATVEDSPIATSVAPRTSTRTSAPGGVRMVSPGLTSSLNATGRGAAAPRVSVASPTSVVTVPSRPGAGLAATRANAAAKSSRTRGRAWLMRSPSGAGQRRFTDYRRFVARRSRCTATGRHGRASPPGRLTLHHRTDDPGREFFLADAAELALGLLAGGDGDDLLEDLPADRGQRRALEEDRKSVV